MLLVTGGAGFIGSHLVERLVELREDVRVFDRFSRGKRENLAAVIDQVEPVEGDLRDLDAVRRAVDSVSIIFHHAGGATVAPSIADPAATFETDVQGTLNLLLAARDAGCRRVVFASSSSVYGNAPGLPKKETMTPAPLSPYAVAKVTGEHLCSVFTHVYGLETVVLRYFNVFGPRQGPRASVIPMFVQMLQSGQTPVIYGDGEQSRDFIYVADVVDANLRAAFAPAVSSKIFNIASGRSVSLNRLLALLGGLLDVEARPHYEPARPGDIHDSVADISAAKEALDFRISVLFEDGLRRTVAAIREPVLT